MSWISRKSSVKWSPTGLGSSFTYDPSPCFNSFQRHWLQISDIIEASKSSRLGVKEDQVLGAVSLLEHMLSLLQLELSSSHPTLHCLDFLLSENILDILLNWSFQTGKWRQALIGEQLKLYQVLAGSACPREQLVRAESFRLPLLKLLNSCSELQLASEDEKSLVLLLNHLCVAFIHRNELLHNYFEKGANDSPKFIIFSLLIPNLHREGPFGQQVRDSLLLCLALSKENSFLAEYIALHSSLCPVLSNALSGLYSGLPRTLDLPTDDWYSFTPDDVNNLPELAQFMNLLDFCNAAVQVAHPNLVKNILAYIYQGFLLLVMGSALLQTSDEELIAATAYLDLFIQSLSEPSLIYCFVKYILTEVYDGHRLIDILVERINSNSKLSLVSLSLMESLIDLNCEEVMLDLVLRHLIPCNHIIASQRTLIPNRDPYSQNAIRFLLLSPNIFTRCEKSEGSLYGDYRSYLEAARSQVVACAEATESWAYTYDGENPSRTEIGVALESCEELGDLEEPSLQSSGYESFIRTNEVATDSGDFESPTGSEISSCLSNTPSIGPFLEALFLKLENMLGNSLYLNLQVTGVISRLAVYPQPLLRSFLLDHSFIFQPSICPLYRIMSGLKQRVEGVLSGCSASQVERLVSECETLLLLREDWVVNRRRHALNRFPGFRTVSSPMERDIKSFSFSSAFTSVFRKRPLNQSSNDKKMDQMIYETSTSNLSDLHNAVMCGILLSEWLKELAAISQEHSVLLWR